MALTDAQCKNTPAPIKGVTKLFDGGGLHLQIDSKGRRYWRLNYPRPSDKKRDVLALGVYPEMTLKEARLEREKAKAVLAEGVDPKAQAKRVTETQQAEAANTFEVVAKAWHEGRAADGERWTEGHAKRVLRSLELHMFPHIGHRAVADVMPLEILSTLRLLEKDGKTDMAHRVLDVTRQVFAFAVRMRYCLFNPASELAAELKTHVVQHYPTITDPEGIGQLLVDIDRFGGSPQVRVLLRLSPLVFTRPSEVRLMRWDELDLEAGVWLKAGLDMKNRIAHVIPLSVQAVALIRELVPITGHYEYVFWNHHKRQPLSDGAARKALKNMGYKGKFSCPKCKGSYPIIEGLPYAPVEGRQMAVEGMKTGCGAELIATQSVHTYEWVPGGTAAMTSLFSGMDNEDGSIVISSQTVATLPENRSRKDIGVGEEVKLTANESVISWVLEPSDMGRLNGSGSMASFQAYDKAGVVKITAQGLDGKKGSISFMILAPVKFVMRRHPDTNIIHRQGVPDCGWISETFFMPVHVNFYNVQAREQDTPATGTGFFAPSSGQMHGGESYVDGYSGWLTIPEKGYDYELGSKLIAPDLVYVDVREDLPKFSEVAPFVAGTYLMDIIWQWKVVIDGYQGGVFTFPVEQQAHEIFADGRSVTYKASHKEECRYMDQTSGLQELQIMIDAKKGV